MVLFADEMYRARSSLAQVVLQVVAFFACCTYRTVCPIGNLRCVHVRAGGGLKNPFRQST